MSEMNGVTQKENVHPDGSATADKGKGKGAATEPTTQDASMDEENSSDEEEVDPVSHFIFRSHIEKVSLTDLI